VTPETIAFSGYALAAFLAVLLMAVVAVSSSREATHKETIHDLRSRLYAESQSYKRLANKTGQLGREIKRLKREAETQVDHEIALRKENQELKDFVLEVQARTTKFAPPTQGDQCQKLFTSQ
jgi:uncharacterized protein YdcH (DUF465 family)